MRTDVTPNQHNPTFCFIHFRTRKNKRQCISVFLENRGRLLEQNKIGSKISEHCALLSWTESLHAWWTKQTAIELLFQLRKSVFYVHQPFKHLKVIQYFFFVRIRKIGTNGGLVWLRYVFSDSDLDVCPVKVLLTTWNHLSACQYLRNPSLLSCLEQFYRLLWELIYLTLSCRQSQFRTREGKGWVPVQCVSGRALEASFLTPDLYSALKSASRLVCYSLNLVRL
jgi:hypothetical protein